MSLRLGRGVKSGPLSSPREHGPDLRPRPRTPRGRGHHVFQLEIGGRSPMWVVRERPRSLPSPTDEAGLNILPPFTASRLVGISNSLDCCSEVTEFCALIM